MSRVENLSQELLKDLLGNFVERGLSSTALSDGYDGVTISTLRQKYCGEGGASDVDFDLALKDLTEADLVSTGPLVPFDNPPNSSVVVIGLFSKNEFAYLTEKGYKAAQRVARAQNRVQKATAPASHVHIPGGTFHHSPIGIGEQVTQSIAVTVATAPVFGDLRRAVDESSIESDQRTELLTHIEAMENAHKTGGFVQRYQEFIACAANHITLVAPFLPALTALLGASH